MFDLKEAVPRFETILRESKALSEANPEKKIRIELESFGWPCEMVTFEEYNGEKLTIPAGSKIVETCERIGNHGSFEYSLYFEGGD